MTCWRLLVALVLAFVLGACSTARPWINEPIGPASPEPAGLTTGPPPPPQGSAAASIAVAVTLSGGGARAAAFGLGVLRELKDTRFEWEGRETTLLDSVAMISGVSGGSVLATYYAAFGDEVFTRFEHDFLLANFQASLIGQVLSPSSLYRLSSPWIGRSNVLAEKLDSQVFRGMNFGQLRALRPRPSLLITATDLTTGAPFEFTPEQFALICSDLNSVPLSFAVAASSSVPLLFSPMTLRNYAGSCPQSAQVSATVDGARNASARMLQEQARSYLDAQERPYLHLVDGGLVDNLGVRSLLERSIAAGSLDASFRNVPPHTIRKLVLVSVNSERDTADRIDASDRVPGSLQVLDALVFGAGARATQETLAFMNDNARRWMKELAASRDHADSPFAPDAEMHVISVSLRDLNDKVLMQVPTAFTILPVFVHGLQDAGRTALRQAPEYQALREGLGLAAVPGP